MALAERRVFRGTVAFSMTELRVQLHESTAIVTSLIIQVVLLLFVSILARDLLPVALFGAIIFSMFGLGQRVQNEAAFVRIDHKLNELYLAGPLAPEAYFLGMSLGVLGGYIAPVAILVAVTVYLVGMTALTAVVLFGVTTLVWLFASSFGYVISTLFRDMRTIWPYASIFYNLFGVLPPVFYPLGFWPAPLTPVALALPPSAAAALVQWTIGWATLSPGQVAFALVALTLEGLGAFAFAIYWARRTVREA
ncbi:MAG TPA: ABC transporter permease [Thermoplasmata archaeon]|nr:ABC transporter permease [Thermoplasmata archaeon]